MSLPRVEHCCGAFNPEATYHLVLRVYAIYPLPILREGELIK